MVSYCIYKFYLNEDSSIIEFRTFTGEGNHIYPTLTVCFSGYGIFNQERIETNAKKYRRFLRGDLWDEGLQNADYDDVSLKGELIFEHLSLGSFNESGTVDIYSWKRLNLSKMKKMLRKNSGTIPGFPFRVSFKTGLEKCYSVDINVNHFPELKDFSLVLISAKIRDYYGGIEHFGNGKSIESPIHLSIFLTYPNQLLRSFPMITLEDIQRREERQRITIMTQGVEVIQKRPNSVHSCKSNWKNDDEEILKSLILNVGCRPKHWFQNSSTPICKSQDSFRELRLPHIVTVDSRLMSKYVPPCREIQTVISTNTVQDLTAADFSIKKPKSEDNITHTSIDIQFKTNGYKEIRNVRAFNEESLIGNLGGYIGLFVGFTLWQIPDAVPWVLIKLKSIRL